MISWGRLAEPKTKRKFWKREEKLGEENSVQGRRAVEGSCAHGTEAGGHWGSGLEAGAAADSLDPCPRSPVVLTHKRCRGCHTPVTKEGSSPCPTPGPAIPPARRNPGGLGSDCRSPQALRCARRQGAGAGAIREGLSSSKGAAREGEGLSTLGRSQGGGRGRRAGWGHGGPAGARTLTASLEVSVSQGL